MIIASYELSELSATSIAFQNRKKKLAEYVISSNPRSSVTTRQKEI